MLELIECRPGFRGFRIVGPLKLEDLEELRQYDDFPDEERPGCVLLDLKEMDTADLPLDQIAFAADFRRDDDMPPHLAIITRPGVSFGRVRQLILYQGVGHRVRVFTQRHEADAWLAAAAAAASEAVASE